jgi:hypothetical protein
MNIPKNFKHLNIMEDEEKIEKIKELLLLKKTYPRRVARMIVEGINVDFYIKKAFWKQVYGKFIIEIIRYRGETENTSYGSLINDSVPILGREDLFPSETEEKCLSDLKQFVYNVKAIRKADIIELDV